MTLEEALQSSTETQCIARDAWKKSGSIVRLISSANTLKDLNVVLTPESLAADDWEIYEIKE